MARLSTEVRIFIVQRNACFDGPTAVVDAVKKKFGIEIPKQTVEAHDPTKASGTGLAWKWAQLFNSTRAKFIQDVSSVGVSHKSVRLRRLDRIAAKAEEMGNMGLMLQVLEQAAKEMGGYYSSKRKADHGALDGALRTHQRSALPEDKTSLDEVLKALVG